VAHFIEPVNFPADNLNASSVGSRPGIGELRLGPDRPYVQDPRAKLVASLTPIGGTFLAVGELLEKRDRVRLRSLSEFAKAIKERRGMNPEELAADDAKAKERAKQAFSDLLEGGAALVGSMIPGGGAARGAGKLAAGAMHTHPHVRCPVLLPFSLAGRARRILKDADPLLQRLGFNGALVGTMMKLLGHPQSISGIRADKDLLAVLGESVQKAVTALGKPNRDRILGGRHVRQSSPRLAAYPNSGHELRVDRLQLDGLPDATIDLMYYITADGKMHIDTFHFTIAPQPGRAFTLEVLFENPYRNLRGKKPVDISFLTTPTGRSFSFEW